MILYYEVNSNHKRRYEGMTKTVVEGLMTTEGLTFVELTQAQYDTYGE